jgi:hypothetical protein
LAPKEENALQNRHYWTDNREPGAGLGILRRLADLIVSSGRPHLGALTGTSDPSGGRTRCHEGRQLQQLALELQPRAATAIAVQPDIVAAPSRRSTRSCRLGKRGHKGLNPLGG